MSKLALGVLYYSKKKYCVFTVRNTLLEGRVNEDDATEDEIDLNDLRYIMLILGRPCIL